MRIGRQTTAPLPGVEVETVRMEFRAGTETRTAVFAWAAPVTVRSGGSEHTVRRGPAALLRAVPRGRWIEAGDEEDNMDSEQLTGAVKVVTGDGAVGAALRESGRADAVATSTTVGDRTIITLADCMFAGGGGGGGGGEGAEAGLGGGSGGFGQSRPVAIVVAGPDGVEVQSVINKTAVAMAGIGAAVGLIRMFGGRRRR